MLSLANVHLALSFVQPSLNREPTVKRTINTPAQIAMDESDEVSPIESLNKEIADLKQILAGVKKAEATFDDGCDSIAQFTIRKGDQDGFLAPDVGIVGDNPFHQKVQGGSGGGGGGEEGQCCAILWKWQGGMEGGMDEGNRLVQRNFQFYIHSWKERNLRQYNQRR